MMMTKGKTYYIALINLNRLLIFTIEWFGTNDPGSYTREEWERDERNRNLVSLLRADEEQIIAQSLNNGQSWWTRRMRSR